MCSFLLEGNKADKKEESSPPLVPRLVPDLQYLFFDYHKTILASLSLVRDLFCPEKGHNALVIGLGGGALPSYIHKVLPMVGSCACGGQYSGVSIEGGHK